MTGKPDPIISEFDSFEEEAAYDAWFRAKVAESLADTRPPVPHEDVMVGARRIIEEHRRRRAEGHLAR